MGQTWELEVAQSGWEMVDDRPGDINRAVDIRDLR